MQIRAAGKQKIGMISRQGEAVGGGDGVGWWMQYCSVEGAKDPVSHLSRLVCVWVQTGKW